MTKKDWKPETEFPNQTINERTQDLIKEGARTEDFLCPTCPRRSGGTSEHFPDEVWAEARPIEDVLMDSVWSLKLSPITVALSGCCPWFGCKKPDQAYIDKLQLLRLNRDQLRYAFHLGRDRWLKERQREHEMTRPFNINNLALKIATYFKGKERKP